MRVLIGHSLCRAALIGALVLGLIGTGWAADDPPATAPAAQVEAEQAIDWAGLIGLRGIEASGKGQLVAILDFGFDKTHPMLTGKIVHEFCASTGVSDVYKVVSDCVGGGWQPPATANVPANRVGDLVACSSRQVCQGTAITLLVAGADARRTFGIAPHAGVVAIQVSTVFEGDPVCGDRPTCALSFTSDQKVALEYVYQLEPLFTSISAQGSTAVVMALGSGYHDKACDTVSALTSTIEKLRSRGVAVFIGAGDDGLN